MNSKIIELSYDTLYNLNDMLIQHIEIEKETKHLLNPDYGGLQKYQRDLKLVNQALTQKLDEAYKVSYQKEKEYLKKKGLIK